MMLRQPQGPPEVTPNLIAEGTSATDACPQLPDLPMLNILGGLPLYQLLVTLPQVSPSPTWTKLVNDSSHARRHLTLLIGSEAETLLREVFTEFPTLPPVDAHNQIVFSRNRLSAQASSILISKLPQILVLTLVIARMDEQEYAQILQLLHSRADHLTQVIFAIEPNSGSTIARASREQALSFQEALNGLSNLHHLTIFMRNWFDGRFSSDSFSLNLPVLARIVSLNLASQGDSTLFLNSIAQYMAGSAAARSIDLADCIFGHQVEKLLLLPENVTRLFRRLHLQVFLPEPSFIKLTDLCPSLTSLTLKLDHDTDDGREILPLALLSRRLSSLSHLTSLTLYLGDLDPHIDALVEHHQGLPVGEERLLAPLPSVTTLTLHLYGILRSHANLFLLHFHQLLPNVERLFLYIKFYKCYRCGFSWSYCDDFAEEVKFWEACAAQLVAPLVPLLARLQLAQAYFGHNLSLFTLHRAHLGPSGEMITVDVTEENAAVKAKRAEAKAKRRVRTSRLTAD